MKPLNILIFFFLILLIGYYGKFLLIPLFFALFFYVILASVSRNFINFVESFNLKLNEFLSFMLMFLIFIFFGYFLFKVLRVNILSVIENVNLYQKNLNQLYSFFKNTPINNLISDSNFLENFNFTNIFTFFLNSLKNFAGNFSMVLVFLIFLVVENSLFKEKIEKVITNKNANKIFYSINNDIYNYFRIKTLTSFLTACLTYFVLMINSNELATTFGIMSFFLNFIPYIGSLISIILPTVFSIIENLNFFQPVAIFLLLLLTHFFVGNFLENKLMGKALNVSPIVLLIFLTLMGKIWGLSGMFLSVPILVTILIFLKNFEQTKKIAILLSEKGNIK